MLVPVADNVVLEYATKSGGLKQIEGSCCSNTKTLVHYLTSDKPRIMRQDRRVVPLPSPSGWKDIVDSYKQLG